MVFCEIRRDSSGSDYLDQYCVNSFSKSLNVTDVHVYVQGLHTTARLTSCSLNSCRKRNVKMTGSVCAGDISALLALASYLPHITKLKLISFDSLQQSHKDILILNFMCLFFVLRWRRGSSLTWTHMTLCW